MNIYLITFLEILYLNYTFLFMKTKYYINHPFSNLRCFEKNEIKNNIQEFFKHPIGKGTSESYICPFGKTMIIILSFYLLFRLLFCKKYYNYVKISNIGVLVLSFILSFMNMNAMIYLIPFFIIELFLIRKYQPTNTIHNS